MDHQAEPESKMTLITDAKGASTTDHEELLQAQSHVFHLAFSNVGMMSLNCAIQLGIPDTIHRYGRPVTLSELVSALPIPASKASCVRRLMRLLAHMGYFAVQADGDAYSLTAVTSVLLNDSFATWLPGMLSPQLNAPWELMSEWFRQERHRSPFEMHHGKTIWAVAGEQPEFNRVFNETLAADSRVLMKAVVTGFREAFEGVTSLVDVGGGDGTAARTIAEAFPRIKCTVYDLPHVIATVPASPLVEAVGGNMFDYIPPADVVFLKVILHGWTDEECVKILRMCKKAIPTKEDGGKVIIVDIAVNVGNDDYAITQTKLYWDMEMMMGTEGKEREECEWKKIFIDAGFSDYKITPLGMRSLIEVFP